MLTGLVRRATARRRGSVLVQTAVFGSLVGVGAMALTVDTGMLFNARGELQSAADAAALAAALQLGSGTSATANAAAQAASIAARNKVKGTPAYVDANDLVFGHAVLVGSKYQFQPNVTPYDSVKVTVRRDGSSGNKPRVPLIFGGAYSSTGASITASATAMLVPRDIAVVFDLSGSMNDDSELRHYKNFASEVQGTRPAVQINLEDVWRAIPCEKGNNGVGNGIDPQPPGNPSNYNDQPGTGPGQPNSQGGNPSPGASPTGPNGGCGGPRWGWMTGFGNALILGQYTPTNDPGLYYIPRSSTCTNADVIANLTEAGYSATERNYLLSGANDGNFTYYVNRVLCCLGLAGWKSKISGGKYSGGPGNGDGKVDTNELTQRVGWPWPGGSWSDFISYVSANNTQMYYTDSSLRYRYGIKTVVNYLMERQANHSSCSDLAAAPEMPIRSAKDAVQAMVDLIVSMDTQDHLSLEVFATSSRHEVNLTVPSEGQSLASALQVVPATLYERQAGHYDSTTNIGAGLNQGLIELTSSRARSAAAKVIILLTDGKPNVGSGNMSPEAYSVDRATAAANNHITIYCVGLGGDADSNLLHSIADIGGGQYFYADSAPDPITGQPLYVSQLNAIFNELGGKRPVRLID